MRWRTPEQLTEPAFERSRLVLVNEAHDGARRCVRTRRIGSRIVAKATELGVRHIAMEALFDRALTETLNRERALPSVHSGYLAQPEMRELIALALERDWTFISYEADMSHKPPELEHLSIEETNWREEQQARNISGALAQLPATAPLLVWCGNHHVAKNRTGDWLPMAHRLEPLSGVKPFSIDQTPSVNFDHPGVRTIGTKWVEAFADTLDQLGGTAGFLAEEAPSGWPCADLADAFILSTDNELS